MRGWWLAFVLACGKPPVTEPPVPTPPDPVDEGGPLAKSAMAKFLPAAPGPALCARRNDDRVTRYFCRVPAPSPTSLRALEAGLEILPGDPGVSIAFTAHSTALGNRSVNPLNPRAIIFDGVPRDRLSKRRFVAAGYTRGEPVVELVTRDETTQQLRFFVVAFTQRCDEQGTCTTADRLTEAAESGWTSTVLYEDVDLENTALDCLRCHQPAGPGTKRILRMQELRFPWTHFLAPKDQSLTGFELAKDYFTAHAAGEHYGGVPGSTILSGSDPNRLSQLIAQEESGDQPNEFPGFLINLERESMGTSPTWDALLSRAASGEVMPVPWWDLRVTDATRQASAAEAYREAVRTQAWAKVPDLRALHTEEVERATGVRPIAQATGREVLTQACAQCHQPARNQQLSRARFDAISLERLPRAAKEFAIERMRLPRDDPRHMPPELTNALTDEELTRAVESLSR